MGASPASAEPRWKGFESQLRRYVRGRVAPGDVDDVIGDILLRLVRHARDLTEIDNATAWIYRVASNAVVDHHRRKSAETRALSRAANRGASEDAGSETGAIAEPDAAAALARCLTPLVRTLPEPYREALLLTDIGGLSQVEAGRRLGISASGMKSRVRRGRAKLKGALLGCCEIELDRRGAVLDFRPRRAECDGECGAPQDHP